MAPDNHRGRRTHNWRKLVTAIRATRAPCGICGQPIDYTIAWPDPQSFSVDHIVARAIAPHLAEDITNLQATHLGCNRSKYTGPDQGHRLGTPSRHW